MRYTRQPAYGGKRKTQQKHWRPKGERSEPQPLCVSVRALAISSASVRNMPWNNAWSEPQLKWVQLVRYVDLVRSKLAPLTMCCFARRQSLATPTQRLLEEHVRQHLLRLLPRPCETRETKNPIYVTDSLTRSQIGSVNGVVSYQAKPTALVRGSAQTYVSSLRAQGLTEQEATHAPMSGNTLTKPDRPFFLWLLSTGPAAAEGRQLQSWSHLTAPQGDPPQPGAADDHTRSGGVESSSTCACFGPSGLWRNGLFGIVRTTAR